MYKDYFNLIDMPFRILPDPLFLWKSDQHAEAKEKILYHLRQSVSPIYLIAQTGTGKSSIAKSVKLELEGDSLKKVVYVMAPELPTINAFLRFVMNEFEVKTDRSYATNLRLFEEFLVEMKKKGHSPILLIDEAQNMNKHMLELIQHLFNFATDKEFLINIALFAQPEFQKKLNRMPALQSRLAISKLKPLDRKQTEEMMKFRWEVASGKELSNSPLPFSDGALNEIHKLTGGIPRSIIRLADLCLIRTAINGKKEVTDKIVSDVWPEMIVGEI